MAQIDEAEIDKRFTHHVPVDEQVRATHDAIRLQFKSFALSIAMTMPESREKSLAFTALEEASFWAHAAVARNPQGIADGSRYAEGGPGKWDTVKEAKGG